MKDKTLLGFFVISIIIILFCITPGQAAEDDQIEDTCGDNICGAYENPANCPKDCKAGFIDYFLCILDDDACFNEEWQQKSQNVMLVLAGIIILIYLKSRGFI